MSLTISFGLVVDFLDLLQVHADRDPGSLNMLCLQGLHPAADGGLEANDNADDVYNDSVVLAWSAPSGFGNVRALLGTVDPGLGYRDIPGGEAHLTFGQHFYVPGQHTGKPALRATGELNRVWRDPDKSNTPTPGDVVSTGRYGVNIHPGGLARVGSWSAGCINICGGWDGEPWKSFMELTRGHFKQHSELGVTIWPGRDYARFITLGTLRPTLSFGTLNPWVIEMQGLLADKGYYEGELDGDWGPTTDASVRAFQKAVNLVVDGVCGEATWGKLLVTTG